jgi:hypothetical protein
VYFVMCIIDIDIYLHIHSNSMFVSLLGCPAVKSDRKMMDGMNV